MPWEWIWFGTQLKRYEASERRKAQRAAQQKGNRRRVGINGQPLD